MSQPVKLSDALVLDARIAGEAEERSIAGQVEFWAKLGRSLDLLLEGGQVMALRRNAEMQPLSEALASVDTPAGRKRVAEVLANQPYPHYKPFPGKHGLLIRTGEDGKQTVGRFVNRIFVEMEPENHESRILRHKAKARISKKIGKTTIVQICGNAKSASPRRERKACA